MRAILLTWNPGPDNIEQWSSAEWDEMVDTYEGGGVDSVGWSVGNHKNNIEPGDDCYLYRQGPHGRGLVARGVIQSKPEPGDHWSRWGKTTLYVDVEWLESLPLDYRIQVEELTNRVPSVPWRSIYSSGYIVYEPNAQFLSDVWLDRRHETWGEGVSAGLAGDAEDLVSSGGAGFGNSEKNREVEQAATRFATSHYKDLLGYQVEDVSRQKCGWDLTITSDDEEWHVELKGVSGNVPRILLTRNEHDAALKDESWILAVVTSALSKPRLDEFFGRVVCDQASAYAYEVSLSFPDAISAE